MHIGNNKNMSFNKSSDIDKNVINEIDKKVDEKIKEITEIIENSDKIEISEVEPTDEDIVIWINPSEDPPSDFIPRINDETMADNTLWSSAKVNQEIQNIMFNANTHVHQNKEVLDSITERNIILWNNKSDFSGSYNDLKDKPAIPSVYGLATEEYVDNAIDNIPKAEIPTKVSELENDSGYITEIPSEYITEQELEDKRYLTNEDIEDLAKREEIPTNVSELVNDSNYAKLTDLHGHNNKNVLDSITDSQVEKWNSNTSFDGDYYSLKNRPNVPARTSELENDSGYITSADVEDLNTAVSSDTEPTDDSVILWVNTSQEQNIEPVARINDSAVANETTWSSEKINEIINGLRLVKEGNIVKLMLGNVELSNITLE